MLALLLYINQPSFCLNQIKIDIDYLPQKLVTLTMYYIFNFGVVYRHVQYYNVWNTQAPITDNYDIDILWATTE